MTDDTFIRDESMIREPVPEIRDDVDADYSGHLAMGLFVGVILVLLVVIYAFASAA